MLGTLLIWEQG